MKFYCEGSAGKKLLQSSTQFREEELQYSAPIYFCEFTTKDVVNHLNDRLFFKLLPKSPKTGQTRPDKKQGGRFGDGNRIGTGLPSNQGQCEDQGQGPGPKGKDQDQEGTGPGPGSEPGLWKDQVRGRSQDQIGSTRIPGSSCKCNRWHGG